MHSYRRCDEHFHLNIKTDQTLIACYAKREINSACITTVLGSGNVYPTEFWMKIYSTVQKPGRYLQRAFWRVLIAADCLTKGVIYFFVNFVYLNVIKPFSLSILFCVKYFLIGFAHGLIFNKIQCYRYCEPVRGR